MTHPIFEEIFTNFKDIQKTIVTVDKKLAFKMGYDCGHNGADEKNCHFSLFSKPELTKEWERGKRLAEQEIKAEENSRPD